MSRRLALVCFGLLFVLAGLETQAGEIHQAITAGDPARVADLLRAHPDLVHAQDENVTRDLPLHTAAIAGNLEIARLLLDAGAEIDGGDADESTALHVAALQRRLDLVAFLLSRGADVNRRDRNGAYALSFALAGGDSLVVARILDAGADLNFVSPAGRRLMHFASNRNRWEVVDRLLARGHDIDEPDFAGVTALFAAVWANDAQRVRRMIALGASVAAADTSGRTPLHAAAERGNPETARLLLAHGAAVDPSDAFGWTPLASAVLTGNAELVRLILEHEADPNRTIWGGTPLTFACLRRGSAEVLRSLLDAGARVDGRDPRFNATLLHCAAELGCADVTGLLLDRGCELGVTDSLGRTALDIAARYGHETVARLLRQRGVKGGNAQRADCAAAMRAEPQPGEARVWYLGHSGWAIETPGHFLVFDYTDPPRLPDNPGLCNGCIDPAALPQKQVIVFASHEHGDHYSPAIFEWRAQIPRITYVLGFRPPEATGYEYVAPHETRDLAGVKVTPIAANDTGEGFLVEVDGLVLFHAGDHACRTRDLSGDYTPEIEFLAGRGLRPDIAMLPISGCNFGDQVAVRTGTEYTLEKLSPRLFLPMHGGRTSTMTYRDFIRRCDGRFPKTRLETIYCAGDHFTYQDGPGS